MRLEQHHLKGDVISYRESPNRSGPFGPDLPDTVVIHFTAGASLDSSVTALCDPHHRASAHCAVGRDGRVVQLVPFDTKAWHAGRSSYGGRDGFNHYAIGIEIDNAGQLQRSGTQFVSWFGRSYPENQVLEAVHRNQTTPAFWHRYTDEQIAAVQEICFLLKEHYPIGTILGHEEIAPTRKVDPGPAFPLDKLREHVFGSNRAEVGPAETCIEVRIGFVDAGRLNIRSAPARAAATVAPPLERGTRVAVRTESGGWSEVDVAIRGWVKSEYLRF